MSHVSHDMQPVDRQGVQTAIRSQVANSVHNLSSEDEAVRNAVHGPAGADFFQGLNAGDDSGSFTGAGEAPSGAQAGWVTVEGVDSVTAPLDCSGQVVYTTEMSQVPELRTCYQKYLASGDRAAYYTCVRQYISSKASKMDLDGGQLFLKSLGLDERRDSTVRLCQTKSSVSPNGGNLNDRIDIFGHVILPAVLSGGVGALVLNNRCGRTMDRNEFYVSVAAIAVTGVVGSLLSNYFAYYSERVQSV